MAVTTILVVSDMATAKRFYLDVLGATLYREYGGTSTVLQFLGSWLLIVTGAEDRPRISRRFRSPHLPILIW